MFVPPYQAHDKVGMMDEDSSREAMTRTIESRVSPAPKPGKKAPLSGMKLGFLTAMGGKPAAKAPKPTERAPPDEDSADDDGPYPMIAGVLQILCRIVTIP